MAKSGNSMFFRIISSETKEMIKKWVKIKQDAYAEWVAELDKIIDKNNQDQSN